MQSYYAPDGLFPRRRTSSATAPPPASASSRYGHANEQVFQDVNGQLSPSPAFTGNIHDSPQSQTSSNASELPSTLHPLPRSPAGATSAGKAGINHSIAASIPLTTSAASPTSPHPRVLTNPRANPASQQYTPDTPASPSERDFPTVSQHSRAPLIRDYGYSPTARESPIANNSPASSPLAGPGWTRTGGAGARYAFDADDAENADAADTTDNEPHSPAFASRYTRPVLVSSYTDMPVASTPTREGDVYPYHPQSIDQYDRRDRSFPEVDLPLPPEGPQDAYVAQHIAPLAPLPSQSQPLPRAQAHDTQSRASAKHGEISANKAQIPIAKVPTHTPDSPPPPSPLFVRHNTAPGLPQPSAAQPLSPGLDTAGAGAGVGPGVSGAGDAAFARHRDPAGPHAQGGKTDDTMPIFHILDAHLDAGSAKTVHKLKEHLDAVARMQDEVCAMHLELEGLAPLDAMRVESGVHGAGHEHAEHADAGAATGADTGKGGNTRKGLFSSKSHDPASTPTSQSSRTGTAATTHASPSSSSTSKNPKTGQGPDEAADAKAQNRAQAEAEAAEIIATRERGVEAIMNKLGALSDQIRAYHHLGTPKLAFRHAGSGAGAGLQPASAHPGPDASFDPISPVLASAGGLGTLRRASADADSNNSILHPSPIIVPPSSATPTGTGVASASPVSPASPEWHTRRLAALHARDRGQDRLPAHGSDGFTHAMSTNGLNDPGRHKPKHPSHLDQVFTARRDSAYTGSGTGAVTSIAGDGMSRAADPDDARELGGRPRADDQYNGDGNTNGDVSPKSTTVDRFFGGFGTGTAYAADLGVRQQDTAKGMGQRGARASEHANERDVKGDQSWIETR